MIKSLIKYTIIIFAIHISCLAGSRQDFSVDKFKSLTGIQNHDKIVFIFNEYYPPLALYGNSKTQEKRIVECIKESFNESTNSCEFVNMYCSNIDYNNYYNAVMSIRNATEDKTFELDGKTKRMYKYPKPLSKDEILDAINKFYCEFFNWCRNNPKAAKYILNSNGFDEIWGVYCIKLKINKNDTKQKMQDNNNSYNHNEYIRSDIKLNAVYKDLKSKLDSKKGNELKLAQRRWLKQRSSICGASPDDYSTSVAPDELYRSWTIQNNKRIYELEGMLRNN